MEPNGFYTPGLMADTGRIRCPMNLPFSSKTAILSEAIVGRTTCVKRGTLKLEDKHVRHLPNLPY